MTSSIFKRLKEAFSGKEKGPVTRLSLDEATRIAMAEAAKHGVTELGFVCCREIEGAVVWIFSEGGRGSIFGVEIRDETGGILRAGRAGGR